MYKSMRVCAFALLVAVLSLLGNDAYLIKQLSSVVPLSEQQIEQLHHYISDVNTAVPTAPFIFEDMSDQLPLFKYYPLLEKSCSYVCLGSLPTPITPCKQLSCFYRANHGVSIYIKRDDLSGCLLEDGSRLFGGNKVGKLEFALADAMMYGCEDIITFEWVCWVKSCIGDNGVCRLFRHEQYKFIT